MKEFDNSFTNKFVPRASPLVQTWDAQKAAQEWRKMCKNIYREILDCVDAGQRVCMVSHLIGETGELSRDFRRELICEFKEELIQQSMKKGVPQYGRQGESDMIAEPFYPQERLIILGGGHIAVPLVEFASKTGFQVILVDDRPSFANTGRFPLAKQVVCDNFEHAIQGLQIKESDYTVIITRGHRHDSACLKNICQGEWPDYVGMIGSVKRTTIVKETLEAEGVNKERLSLVHTPIGLKIGAVTPEEIAVSILAELISHKRLGLQETGKRNASDMDFELLLVLAEETDVPKAVITVIHTKGPVPRGAGAKMIVYQDGRVLGSIGGGCSEAAVAGAARQMIGSNTFQIVDIDLTGDAAEDEGMVCGGRMTVLLEDYILQTPVKQ